MKRFRKRLREKGKVKFSEYFKELKIGEKVAIRPSVDFPLTFPLSYRGLTGIVIGKKKRCVLVEVKKNNKKKVIVSRPIHLKRIG